MKSWFIIGGMGVLGLASLCYVGKAWIAYTHPATSTTSTVEVKKNVVRTEITVKPDGTKTTIEEHDTSTTGTVQATMSTPVFAPGPRFGIQGYKDVVGSGWMFGPSVKPFDFLEIGVMTNDGFNKLMIGGTIWIK